MREVVIPAQSYRDWRAPRTPEQRMDIAEAIKKATGSSWTKSIRRDVVKFVTDPQVRENEIPQMVEEVGNYAKALLLVKYTIADLPDIYKEKFSINSKPQVTAKPELSHASWTLCDTSEERMLESLSDYSTMIVGGLMVKIVGKSTALCFESFTNSYGTFIEGNFYSPDLETQKSLKENFFEGNVAPDLNDSTWVLMRDVRPNLPASWNILARAKERAANMPTQLPSMIQNMDREGYYKKKKEEYRG